MNLVEELAELSAIEQWVVWVFVAWRWLRRRTARRRIWTYGVELRPLVID